MPWEVSTGYKNVVLVWEEKPAVDAYHHEVGQYYQTLNHTCFTQETPFNMLYTWKREFYGESNCTLFFCGVFALM